MLLNDLFLLGPRPPLAQADRPYVAESKPVSGRAAPGALRPMRLLVLLAMSYLFGPVACGIVAGVNFSRLGKRRLLVPCVLLGIAFFTGQAMLFLFWMPDVSSNETSRLMRVVVGIAFMGWQRQDLEAWKSINGGAAELGAWFHLGQISQLFLTGMLSILIQKATVLLIVSL